MFREAREDRRNEPDENDDQAIKDGYRGDFIRKIVLVTITVVFFASILFLRLFVFS